MTLEEKRDAIRNYCDSRCAAHDDFFKSGNCPLYDVVGYENCYLEGADIERNYAVLFGDPVDRPSHYTDGKIEVIDFIEDKKLGFCLGNVVKYVARAGKKDPSKEVEDLKKARWYLDRRIKEVEESDV